MKSLVTEPHRLGMVLFILSEAAFFAVLISSYILTPPTACTPLRRPYTPCSSRAVA